MSDDDGKVVYLDLTSAERAIIKAAAQADADRRVDRQILRNAEMWAGLRARVVTLHAEALAGKRANRHSPTAADMYGARAAGIAAVLALIDGGQ